MYIGNYTSKLSGKGRTALPSKFREELGNKVIVARWYEGCLVIIDEKNWMNLLDKVTGKSEIITKGVRDTDRFILSSAFEVELDDQGRFVIPKNLREYSNLKNEVVYLGLGNRVEIWDKAGWEEQESYVQKNASEALENLANANNKRSNEAT